VLASRLITTPSDDGNEAGGGTPADAAAFVKLEVEKREPVIKAANISLN
jgi:hypothetical protein